MVVTRRPVPPGSTFLPALASAYYWDSFEAPLTRDTLAMHEIYLALFAHHPVLGQAPAGPARPDRRPARPEGVDRCRLRRRWKKIKSAYQPGEKIARFTLFGQSDAEAVVLEQSPGHRDAGLVRPTFSRTIESAIRLKPDPTYRNPAEAGSHVHNPAEAGSHVTQSG